MCAQLLTISIVTCVLMVVTKAHIPRIGPPPNITIDGNWMQNRIVLSSQDFNVEVNGESTHPEHASVEITFGLIDLCHRARHVHTPYPTKTDSRCQPRAAKDFAPYFKYWSDPENMQKVEFSKIFQTRNAKNVTTSRMLRTVDLRWGAYVWKMLKPELTKDEVTNTSEISFVLAGKPRPPPNLGFGFRRDLIESESNDNIASKAEAEAHAASIAKDVEEERRFFNLLFGGDQNNPRVNFTCHLISNPE